MVDRKIENGSIYVLDYDLPVGDECTRAFYRKSKKILAKNGYSGKSTKSVLKLHDEQTARAIFDLAAKCGTVHVYRAKKLDF